MKKQLSVLCILTFIVVGKVFSQNTSPYTTDFWKDGVWVVGGIGLNAYGLYLIKNKDDLTEEKLGALSADDVFILDRWAAGYFSERASNISDIPFYSSFITPFFLFLDKDIRAHAGQVSVLLLESMSTAGALFSISAGLINRSRPLVYNEDLPLSNRLSKNAQRSFFSGHVAASAAATFFAAQVFSDFFPDAKAKPYIWAAAAAVPAVVGYFRIKSGNHFLTDTLIGYAIGAASGILIPRIHKKKDRRINIVPAVGFQQQALMISYRF